MIVLMFATSYERRYAIRLPAKRVAEWLMLFVLCMFSTMSHANECFRYYDTFDEEELKSKVVTDCGGDFWERGGCGGNDNPEFLYKSCGYLYKNGAFVTWPRIYFGRRVPCESGQITDVNSGLCVTAPDTPDEEACPDGQSRTDGQCLPSSPEPEPGTPMPQQAVAVSDGCDAGSGSCLGALQSGIPINCGGWSVSAL